MANGVEELNVYFYPHSYLRDRHLDVIRGWNPKRVVNPELARGRRGAQVSREAALATVKKRSWKQRLPLPNVKMRPLALNDDTFVYVWGGVMATGKFVVDLDNPYSLVGYNLGALQLWRPFFRRILLAPRCLEIRCLSLACKKTLTIEFGADVAEKARVCYPSAGINECCAPREFGERCRFLFVGTQFELKGGHALLDAFERISRELPNVELSIIAYVDEDTEKRVARMRRVIVQEPVFSREELFAKVYPNADVLIHPTYVESFGMVVLEALAAGLPVIATDVYAIREMVEDGINGILLKPPITVWDGVVPSRYFYEIERIKWHIRRTDMRTFVGELASAMARVAVDPELRRRMSDASRQLFRIRMKRA